MITFFVTGEGRFGIDAYAQKRGAALRHRIRVVTYDTISQLSELPATGTIFAAVDQIGSATAEAVCHLADRVVATDTAARVLNRPDRALRRYDLLTQLVAAGINQFRARRAADGAEDLRYPVFIRSERRHSGSHTPLLHDRAAVRQALATLVVRGRPLSDLLIVEFCDTVGADGLFRKYSALRVGDAIIPWHLHASTHWVVKSDARLLGEGLVHEEIDYVSRDPHARWLRQVFDLAAIEYGRIDYGIWRGQPQVWEINTNPTFGRGHRHASDRLHDAFAALRDDSRDAINRRLLEAFAALERPEPVKRVPTALAPTLVARLTIELRAQDQAQRRVRRRRTLTTSPWTQAVKRLARPLLTAIAGTALRLRRSRSRGGR
jgi:hypothetical protein